MACLSNLRQTGIAVFAYCNDNEGYVTRGRRDDPIEVQNNVLGRLYHHDYDSGGGVIVCPEATDYQYALSYRITPPGPFNPLF